MKHMLTFHHLLLWLAVLTLANSQMMDKVKKKGIILAKLTKTPQLGPNQCLEYISESYGFISTVTPVDKPLQTCPDANNTCCAYESQKIMIIQMMGDAKAIELRFENQNKILYDLLNEIKLDLRYIERFKRRQQEMRMSNCKAIATKLSFHDIDHIKDELMKHREEMLDFVQRAHKGVYCAVCTPSAQRHIMTDRLIMRVSFKFCRNLVVHTIKPMMYMHYEFKKFLNLMTKFMTNCDERGQYTANVLPDEVLLQYHTDEKIVRDCWEQRNDPEWINACAAYCDRFDSMKFDQFWEPHLHTYMRLTYYLKKRRMALNLIEKNDILLSSDTSVKDVQINSKVIPIIRNDQVVQEEDELDEYHEEDLDAMKRGLSEMEIEIYMMKFKNNKVVSGDIGGQISLSDFKFLYANKGIDYEELGRNSVATDSLLKEVEMKLNSQRKLELEFEGATEGGYRLDKHGKARFTMQTGGLATGFEILCVLALGLMFWR